MEPLPFDILAPQPGDFCAKIVQRRRPLLPPAARRALSLALSHRCPPRPRSAPPPHCGCPRTPGPPHPEKKINKDVNSLALSSLSSPPEFPSCIPGPTYPSSPAPGRRAGPAASAPGCHGDAAPGPAPAGEAARLFSGSGPRRFRLLGVGGHLPALTEGLQPPTSKRSRGRALPGVYGFQGWSHPWSSGSGAPSRDVYVAMVMRPVGAGPVSRGFPPPAGLGLSRRGLLRHSMSVLESL